MNTPWVSCLMPTYNRCPERLWLVNEAVESFLKQDYPPDKCELIILNDTPGQVLYCSGYERVITVNVPCRFRSLGEKRNALVGMARGDILLPWDDDDISLPNRIKQAVERIWDGEEARYWNPRHYWFWNEQADVNGKAGLQVPGSLGYAHNCSAYTRKAFQWVHGYPYVSGVEDRDMDYRLRRKFNMELVDGLNQLRPEEWSYIYRWGVSERHLSGIADTNQAYKDIGTRPIPFGVYPIEPGWRVDYVELVKEAIKEMMGMHEAVSI